MKTNVHDRIRELAESLFGMPYSQTRIPEDQMIVAHLKLEQYGIQPINSKWRSDYVLADDTFGKDFAMIADFFVFTNHTDILFFKLMNHD